MTREKRAIGLSSQAIHNCHYFAAVFEERVLCNYRLYYVYAAGRCSAMLSCCPYSACLLEAAAFLRSTSSRVSRVFVKRTGERFVASVYILSQDKHKHIHVVVFLSLSLSCLSVCYLCLSLCLSVSV